MTKMILGLWEGIDALSGAGLLGLLATSFAGSFITTALGIGGGALLLAVMASLMPPAALIPVHGVIQLGSNFTRAAVLLPHMHWPPMMGFALGALIGVAVGGLVVVELPGYIIQVGVGAFVVWSVLLRPPRWLSVWPWLTGLLSSFLTMFFGATGLFVANFSKSLILSRQGHVATHAGLMAVQHALKVVVFGVLGFAYAEWLVFIALMIGAGLAGTFAGRAVLLRISDRHFKRALDVILLVISARLILIGLWEGLSGPNLTGL